MGCVTPLPLAVLSAQRVFVLGGEDHLTQCLSDPGPPSWRGPDLWRDHGPAVGENGTFSTLLYGPEAVKIVTEHSVSSNVHSRCERVEL